MKRLAVFFIVFLAGCASTFKPPAGWEQTYFFDSSQYAIIEGMESGTMSAFESNESDRVFFISEVKYPQDKFDRDFLLKEAKKNGIKTDSTLCMEFDSKTTVPLEITSKINETTSKAFAVLYKEKDNSTTGIYFVYGFKGPETDSIVNEYLSLARSAHRQRQNSLYSLVKD